MKNRKPSNKQPSNTSKLENSHKHNKTKKIKIFEKSKYLKQ